VLPFAEVAFVLRLAVTLPDASRTDEPWLVMVAPFGPLAPIRLVCVAEPSACTVVRPARAATPPFGPLTAPPWTTVARRGAAERIEAAANATASILFCIVVYFLLMILLTPLAEGSFDEISAWCGV